MAQVKRAPQLKQVHAQKQQKQPLLKQLTTFTTTTPGFERTLRLIQALAQIASDLSSHNAETATRWATAKSQIALSMSPGRPDTPGYDRIQIQIQ